MANDSPNPNVPANAAEFKPLVLGSPAADEMLRRCGVPKGSLVHLDGFKAPDTFLYALALSALHRGERVTIIYVPTASHLESDPPNEAAIRSGDWQVSPVRSLMEIFGLHAFCDPHNPAHPDAALRYLVAGTPDEFEHTLDGLLTCPATAPDLIAVYGLEQLFAHLPLFAPLASPGAGELARVQSEHARLRRWLQKYREGCLVAGTSLWLACSLDFYNVSDPSLFCRGLSPLLYAHCPVGLLVADADTPAPLERGDTPGVYTGDDTLESDLPDDQRWSANLEVFLYQFDALQGGATAALSTTDFSGVGPFLNPKTPTLTP